MTTSAVRDPGPTGLLGDLPNSHNGPGDFTRNCVFVLLEAGFATMVLRPWSYRRNWGRSLCVFLLLLPWVWVNFIFLIHSGGIMIIHTVWLLTLWLGCGIAAILSAVASVADARAVRTPVA